MTVWRRTCAAGSESGRGGGRDDLCYGLGHNQSINLAQFDRTGASGVGKAECKHLRGSPDRCVDVRGGKAAKATGPDNIAGDDRLRKCRGERHREVLSDLRLGGGIVLVAAGGDGGLSGCVDESVLCEGAVLADGLDAAEEAVRVVDVAGLAESKDLGGAALGGRLCGRDRLHIRSR